MSCKPYLFILLSVLTSPMAGARNWQDIKDSGILLVGSTGDYPPLTLRSRSGQFSGFAIDMAQSLANYLGQKAGRPVEVHFVWTHWSDLHNDLENDRFDIAMGGITRTNVRRKKFLLSNGVMPSGKVALVRKELLPELSGLNDADLILALNRPERRVVENPGGTNQLFAEKHLNRASLILTADNREPFLFLAKGKADVMITDLLEACHRIKLDPGLAIANPAMFTDTRSEKV